MTDYLLIDCILLMRPNFEQVGNPIIVSHLISIINSSGMLSPENDISLTETDSISFIIFKLLKVVTDMAFASSPVS